MIQQLKLAAFVLLIGLAVVLLLTVTCGDASGGDYTVTRSTTIESQRPIWLLVVEAGMGVISDRQRSGSLLVRGVSERASEAGVASTLRIDGRSVPGIGGMVSAAWRLVGFVVWDEAGRIERVTTLSVRGHVVNVHDMVSNGSVRVRVVVDPPLGDRRVRFAVLELEAKEDEVLGNRRRVRIAATAIKLECSAIIDIPGDRCRLVRRIAERVAEREAGPELRSRVDGIAEAGIRAVRDGRSEISEAVSAFLERVCR